MAKEAKESRIIKLYKGEVEIKFFTESHIYMVNGVRAGSVTGAIGIIDKSRALVPWAVDLCGDFLVPLIGKKLTEEMIDEALDQHNIKKEAAANIGTTTHEWIENFVKGQDPEMPRDKNVLQAVTAFLRWVEEHQIKFVESEKLVYSKKYGYVGTMDAIATMGGKKKKFLIDYKVSNGLYPGVAYQTAAYLMADKEEAGTEYEGRWAIRLSKESEEEYYQRQEKKLNKWLKKNPGKSPYKITPYTPFEARYLDDNAEDLGCEFKGFVHALELSRIHALTDKKFFSQA